MRIAAAQLDLAWHDRDANHAKAEQFAAQAAQQDVDLLIFPELFATGFSMDTTVTAEPPDGPTPILLRRLAREHRMNLIGGFAREQANGKPQNVSLAVDREGKDAALYAKVHLIGLLDEPQHYAPGSGPEVVDLAGVPCGMFICYDLRFPEVFRQVSPAAELLVVIASWPASRADHWRTLLPARALENQCFVIGVNRVGTGGGLDFAGGSMVVDPNGGIVREADDQEQLLVVDIDTDDVQRVRAELPFLGDRRF